MISEVYERDIANPIICYLFDEIDGYSLLIAPELSIGNVVVPKEYFVVKDNSLASSLTSFAYAEDYIKFNEEIRTAYKLRPLSNAIVLGYCIRGVMDHNPLVVLASVGAATAFTLWPSIQESYQLFTLENNYPDLLMGEEAVERTSTYVARAERKYVQSRATEQLLEEGYSPFETKVITMLAFHSK